MKQDNFSDLLKGFCRADCSRLEFLKTLLEWKKIPYHQIDQGGIHLLIRNLGKKAPLPDHYTKVLTAHYDRVKGTPGANDNSASVFILLKHLDYLMKADFSHNTVILFTDREELTSDKTMYDQGAYQLGKNWGKILGKDSFFTVLDMCGIGDTLVWGRSDLKMQQKDPDSLGTGKVIRSMNQLYNSLSDLLYRYSRHKDMALVDLFSDDLGFILNGYPAIQLSVLPWKEADHWQKDRESRPPSWEVNHTSRDRIETLEESAFRLMDKFLRDLSRYQFPLPL